MLSTGLFMANRQRLIAERRFQQLRHLSEQVFDLDTRISRLAGATDARQALVATSLEYLEGLAADARGDLDLMQQMSDGYWRVARIQGVPVSISLGDFVKAEESLKKADDLVETVLQSRPRHLPALERSAMIAHDRMIVAQSERRDADALAHARKAVERAETLLGDAQVTANQREMVLSVYANVATAHVNMHLYEEGARYARRELEIARSHAVQRHVSYALSVLANALRLQGDLEEALKAIREAHQIVDKLPTTSQTLFDRYAILLREAFILGDDRGVSLDRPAEAIGLLREAVDMHEAAASRDPNDSTSRTRSATSGRELGDILRWRAPRDAVAVYDVALGRLDEIQNNVKARRDKALVLANSSYALRRVNRAAEAKRRLDEALIILKETKDHPSDRISLGSELRSVLQAWADHEADEGRVGAAVEQYEQLLEKVMAARPDVDHDLSEAYSLSLLYRDLARLHRLNGASGKAVVIDGKRLAIRDLWSRKLPDNPFVLRQLAGTDADAAGSEQSHPTPSTGPATAARPPRSPGKRPR
jgi:serine/threonine-protein kinase